mmetsp:Transcript_13900/g.37859  ORF Transcript_13900/g.37859 Transcript_13900/m.37859 type:complete len:225 (-) Transcript_13900:367-1041(-)
MVHSRTPWLEDAAALPECKPPMGGTSKYPLPELLREFSSKSTSPERSPGQASQKACSRRPLLPADSSAVLLSIAHHSCTHGGTPPGGSCCPRFRPLQRECCTGPSRSTWGGSGGGVTGGGGREVMPLAFARATMDHQSLMHGLNPVGEAAGGDGGGVGGGGGRKAAPAPARTVSPALLLELLVLAPKLLALALPLLCPPLRPGVSTIPASPSGTGWECTEAAAS